MTTSMKFRVKDEEHSKAIQEKLFEIGLKWGSYDVGGIHFENKPYLFSDEWYITYDSGPDSDYFEDHLNEEYILLDGELVPADSIAAKILSTKLARNYPDTVVAEDFSPKPAVEGPVTSTGGSSGYYKLRITNRKGETIECETGDIIRCMLDNDFDLGNILKALRRMSLASKGVGKAGTDIAYDVKKSKYFLDEFEHWNK